MAKKLSIFNDKNAVTQEVLDLLFDKAINNRYASLEEYCKAEDYKADPEELAKLTRLVDTRIHQQLFLFAHLMYQHMEVSGKWGEPGEQQVKIAFCRNLLQVSPKRTLTQEDAQQFIAKVDENLENLDIKSLSAAEAQARLKMFKFELFGKTFESFRALEVDRIMRFAGSKRFLHGGQYGADQEFILGEGRKVHKNGYDVIYLSKELVRTPNNVMSMAAIIGHRNIFIRIESLQTIFAQKWLQMFNYTEEEKQTIRENPYWDIAEGIKQRVLKYYNVAKRENLETMEKTFLNDMAETILYHELGHGIIQHDLLPLELGAIGEATKLYGENIYTAMLEFLADFAPPKDELVGPIHNMIQISKKDPDRAQRMYFMYFSDTWFFNTEDRYMYTYSDLMALILLRYIGPQGQVDFEALEADLQFRPNRVESDKLTLFERIYELYIWDAQEIKNLVTHATFTLMDHKLDYKKVREMLVSQFLKNDGFVHEETYEFLVPFWTNMLGYIQQISDSKKQLADYIHNQQRKNLMKMMVLSCGRKKAEEYNFDHRAFIVDRLKELGISAKI